MKITEEYLIQISSEHTTGCGILCAYDDSSENGIIITAKHCIPKDNSGETILDNISLIFQDSTGDQSTLQLAGDTPIILSEISDLAILVIKNNNLPENYKGLPLIELTGNEQECFIRGFSRLTAHEEIRTLSSAKIVEYIGSRRFQIEIGGPVVDNYNADVLLEGYSGSGVCIKTGEDLYTCGIISEYEGTLKRFTAVNFTEINTLLSANGFPSLTISTVETDEVILQDISRLRSVSESFLNRVKSQIGEIHLDRSELKKKLKEVLDQGNLSVVSGKAGNGKSALIKSILYDLSSTFEIIVLTGESIDKSHVAKVFTDLNIHSNIEQLFNSPGLKPQKIILIDSIEKILETNNAATISDFLNLLNAREDIHLILGCRQYALQNLAMRFLTQYRSFGLVEISGLTDLELEQVFAAYPSIQQLAQSARLKNLLKIPFNLDKAVAIKNPEIFQEVVSEQTFRKVFWEYVIENKEKETDRNINQKRGTTFSIIALERIKQMTSFARVKDVDPFIIQQLLSDNIIQEDPGHQNAYSPSHDIYEDWALLKFIDEEFNNWIAHDSITVKNFFDSIGNHSGIRRGFRNWLNEALNAADYNLKLLISKSLTSDEIESYWKDEILIAILRSEFSRDFLNDNSELLFENNFLLFERFLLMLKVGCQVRDEEMIRLLAQKDPSQLTTVYIPDGPGWKTMLDFIDQHFERLKDRIYSILVLIIEWKGKVSPNKELPEESKAAGSVLIKIISLCKEKNDFNSEITGSIVPILFKLTEVIKEPLKLLMEEAIENEKTTESIKYLYVDLINRALKWENSRELSRFLPDTVLNYAEKKWFFQAPEIPPGVIERNPILSYRISEKGKRETFGITNSQEFKYSPPSEYQTPIIHLLKHAPEKTIAFIVKLFNHSIDSAKNSNYFKNETLMDELGTIEISYALEDGTRVEQYGHPTLWEMYREGRIAAPALLQSVLMALEDWMLQLCDFIKFERDPNITDILKERVYFLFDYLIRHSKSVATTGLLVGIATAYPQIIGKRVLPLLTVRKFFKWDLMRVAGHRSSPIIPPDFDNLYAQEKRFKSNELPHRKEHMESLVLQLSQTKLQPEIFKIIDTHIEQATEDDWKLVLNRIDLRKFEPVGRTSDSIILAPKIDPELEPMVNEFREEQNQINPIFYASDWSLKKYRGKELENDSYEEWKSIMTSMQSISMVGIAATMNPSGIIAAVGLRDYFNQLQDEEKVWSINRLFFIIESEITRSFNPYNTDPLVGYSSFEVDPAVDAICLIIHLYSDSGIGDKALELCFSYLAFVDHNTPDRKDLIKKIRGYLSINQPNRVKALVKGMIEYSKLFNTELVLRHSSLTKKERKKIEKEYNLTMQSIITELIAPLKEFTIQGVSIETHSIWYLLDAVAMIPYDTKDNHLQDLVGYCVNTVISNSNNSSGYGNDEKIPYNLRQEVESYYANYLLHQDNPTDQFSAMVSTALQDTNVRGDGAVELVNHCLDNMVNVVSEEHQLIANFWVLWDALYIKMIEKQRFYFIDTFFLSHRYLNFHTDNWTPLRGRKQFYLPKIFESEIRNSIIKLVSGPGFTELIPDTLPWLAKKVSPENLPDISALLEKLIQKIFSSQSIRESIRSNGALRNDFIRLLDLMIDSKSTVAFFVREDFISTK